MLKIISVVGARPNFIKIAPLHKVFHDDYSSVSHLVCHTGQHFDENMSHIFFREFEMPSPDFYLGVSGGSHADQTARIMIEFEKVLQSEKPDLVIVPGDVNSTLACSLVAAKERIPVAHIEAGLRSFDREMPEEINRIVTDVLADYLFVSEPSGLKNLAREGIDEKKVFYVGNIMIDSLVRYLPKIVKSGAMKQFHLQPGKFVIVTFHRPSNVDSEESLSGFTQMLSELGNHRQIVFPVHPRTKAKLVEYNLLKQLNPSIQIIPPIGYIDFLNLVRNAELVITDSGGIQEECTYLGVQCITVRNNTERPVTVEMGTNQLIGTDLRQVRDSAMKVFGGFRKEGRIPELWDGHTGERIAKIVVEKLSLE
jgi:UDP-N-acetylglucosamine 2-epimerase (non-hydrolysing)